MPTTNEPTHTEADRSETEPDADADERLLLVPASLIEEADIVMREGARHERYIMAARLDALLSQLTPTSVTEADLRERVANLVPLSMVDGRDRRADVFEVADEIISEVRASTSPFRRGPMPADPPRIEEMAPGTTLNIVEQWTVAADPNGEKFIYRPKRFARFAEDVDPSTIRDVNPPASDSSSAGVTSGACDAR